MEGLVIVLSFRISAKPLPFLMIDHVTEVIPGKFAKGYKNLTLNGRTFQNSK